MDAPIGIMYGIVGAIAARLVSTLSNRQVISSIVQHNVEWDRLTEYGHKSSWIRRFEHLALQLVDDVVMVSEADKRIMLDMGVEANKITVIPHGVDVQTIRVAYVHRDKWRSQYRVQINESCSSTVLYTMHPIPMQFDSSPQNCLRLRTRT